ncbi:uncharacterized protein [Paramormyrops kingsleyae]|uniref:uncharacterized protein isoform X9 n=1 Tax=Paramormyrops kingsleyae TaxID=1676925 RepID=UPI003B975597
MPKTKRSKMWLYFTRKDSDTVACSKCFTAVECKGGNTSNLMKHLRVHGINLKAERCTVFDSLRTTAGTIGVDNPSPSHTNRSKKESTDYDDDSNLSAEQESPREERSPTPLPRTPKRVAIVETSCMSPTRMRESNTFRVTMDNLSERHISISISRQPCTYYKAGQLHCLFCHYMSAEEHRVTIHVQNHAVLNIKESRERDRKKRRAERQKETDEEPALKKTASMVLSSDESDLADEAPISFTSDLYIQRLEERAHEVQQKPKQDCSVLTGYITKNYNVRQHLEAICTGMLESPWETEKAQKPMVHFEDDEQMDEVFAFLSGIVKNTAEARQLTDEISFILDVLLPEATIHALAGVHSLCEEAARQMYLRGPQYDWRLQRTPSRITQLSQTRNAHTFYGTSNASLYDWPKSSPPGTPTGYIKVSAACTV